MGLGRAEAVNAVTPASLPETPPLTIRRIQRRVAEEFHIDPMWMTAEGRSDHETAHARQVAIFLARMLTGRSVTVIGRAFRRDHSTVINCTERVKDRMRRDGELTARIDRLIKVLREADVEAMPESAEDLVAEFAGLLRQALRRDPIKLLLAVRAIAKGQP